MAAINLHYPKMKVFQLSSTQVASGALINTYEAGTSTAKATYSDQALTTANANPVVADSNGEAQVWLLDDGLYKIVITDSDSVAISTVDNVGTAAAASDTDGYANLVPNGSFETNTGDNGTPTGWTLSITGTSTIQIDQADTFHGDSALEFVGGASGAGTAISGYFPVQSSKEIGIRFSLKASAATVNQTVTLLWYTDDAGTAASSASTAIYTVTTTAPTSWTEQVLTATPGSDVLFAKIQIAGSADAGTTRYDDVAISNSVSASQTLVDAGTESFYYVTPETLAGYTPVSPSGYVGGIEVHVESDVGAVADSDDLASLLTVTTWEDIGPTGSGATNIMSGLDAIPLTASVAILKIRSQLAGATDNDLYTSSLYMRSTASSVAANSQTLVNKIVFYNSTAAGETHTQMTIAYAPLDSTNSFDGHYIIAGTSPTVEHHAHLIGWID